jgi:WD40 repeat protein
LISLADADWDRPPEAEGVDNLIALARKAVQTQPELFLLKTIEAHPEGITALAGHPEKPLIFSAGREQTVRIWHAHKETPYEKLILKNGLAMVMYYDPVNGLLTTGNSDNLIYIYRLHDQHLVKTFVGHRAPIKSLAFSNDGHLMASGSFDTTTKLWRYPTGPELKTVKAHKGEIFSVAESPINGMVISAGADRSIQTYQFADLALVKRIKAHQDTILTLAAGHHSQILASASRDQSIQLWQLPSLEHKADILTPESVITHLTFQLEDQMLIGADMEGQIEVWQVHNQKKVLSRQDHTGAITGLQVLDQGRLLATAGMDGKLQIYLLSAFILARRPLHQINLDQINDILETLTATRIKPNQRAWVAFTEQMVKWRARFDIQLENAAPINLGEFDIEL